MTLEKLIIDGFEFQSKKEFTKAKKELEAIVYMKEKSKWERPNVALKIYNKLLDNDTFHTIIGYEFLKELRTIIVNNDLMDEKDVRTILLQSQEEFKRTSLFTTTESTKLKKYQELYENAITGRKMTKVIIIFLLLIIVGMGIITYKTEHNDTFSDVENRVINEYEEWKITLEAKEKELNAREEAIEDKENN